MLDSSSEYKVSPGTRIGQYRIIRKIGSGGSGEVYLCRHIVLDKSYAIKLLHIPTGEAGEDIKGRLLREARIARSIRHRYLVPVLDANINYDGSTAWIVMEYVDGETLSELLEREPLPESAALYVCRCVALVLIEAEKHNIVHRDIKPDNILIDRTGNVKVTDLGIAKIDKSEVRSDEPVTREEKLLGTPDYASPEQLRAPGSVDARADIYSLGATLYHMLSGHKPFEANGVFNLMAQVLESEPPEIPGISPATASLLKKMMAKDPAQRPQNGRELISELRRVSLANARQTSEIRKFLAGGARRIFSDENAKIFYIIRNTFIITCAIAAGVMIFLHLFYEYGSGISVSNAGKQIISVLDKKNTARLRKLYEANKAPEIIKAVKARENPEYLLRAIEMVPELVKKPEYASLWLNALSGKESRNMLKTLLKSGFDVNAAKAPDHSPAVFRKELVHDDGLLKLLLEHGLNATALDADGRTALLRMARNPKSTVKCAALLLMAGVPINSRDKSGRNALIAASHSGNPELVRFLFNSGIVLTQEDIARIPDTYNLKTELLQAEKAKKIAEQKKAAQAAELEIPQHKPSLAPKTAAVQKKKVADQIFRIVPRQASKMFLEKVKKESMLTAQLKKKRETALSEYDGIESQKMRRKIEVYLQTNPARRLPIEGEKEFIESLFSALQSGRINPDIRTGKESVHLLGSVANGDIFPQKRLFRTLLAAGADPDAIAMPENPALCRMLLLFGRTKFDSKDMIKLLSVPVPDWESAEKMLLRGADPSVQNQKRKENAFHRAAALGNSAFLELLLESAKPGADALDADGHTPYQRAIICGQDKAARMLEQHGFKSNFTAEMLYTGKLFKAIKRNQPEKIGKYLQQGALATEVNGMYLNALQYAVENNRLKAAQALLENGVRQGYFSGISPLETALKNGNDKMFILLISHGGDPGRRIKDRFGRSSLLFTAVFRYLNSKPDKLYNCFRAMLENNWKWKNTTPDGDDPLSWMEKWNEGNPRIKALFEEFK